MWFKRWRRQVKVEKRAKARAERKRAGKRKRKGKPTACKRGQPRTFHVRLKALGFDSYREYLSSELWKRVRQKVFDQKGRKCELCGGRATQVHHRRYRDKDMLGTELNCLHPICGGCHLRLEFKDGKKLTLGQTWSRWKKIKRHGW